MPTSEPRLSVTSIWISGCITFYAAILLLFQPWWANFSWNNAFLATFESFYPSAVLSIARYYRFDGPEMLRSVALFASGGLRFVSLCDVILLQQPLFLSAITMLPNLPVTLFSSAALVRCAAVVVLLVVLWSAIAWAVALP